MEINGRTRTCGLIGNPVEHTLSPVIHNTLAQRFGHNLVYVPFPVEPGRLGEAVAGASALKLLGLNVTVPYKGEVIPFLREVDALAAAIGAVNTLVTVPGGFKGYNTDMEGLYRAMMTEDIQITDEEIILLGAGGASRAVAYLCAVKGAKKVYLLNRTEEKAQKVAEEVNRSVKRQVIFPMALSDFGSLLDRKFLAIQGTSVGLAPYVNDVVIDDAKFYEKVHTGFDLIYSPWETKFMKLVKENGGHAYNGLKMLLYQGIIAYELWNKVKVSKEDADVIYGKLRECL